MKIINKLFVLFAAASFVAVSCAKTQEYEPAPVPEGDQVYFPTTAVSSFDLNTVNGVGKVTLSIPAYRIVSDAARSVNVTVVPANGEAPAVVPASSISFAAGAKASSFDIVVDKDNFVQDSEWAAKVVIADASNVSEYGDYEIDVKIVYPAPQLWVKFDKGVMIEAAWGEEEAGKTMYYMEYRTVTFKDGSEHPIRKCKVEGCWGHNTIEAGDPYDVQDYVWYWDTATDNCYVVPQFMGYVSSSNGECLVSDAAGFYTLYQGWEDQIVFLSDYYFEWAPSWMAKNNFMQPHYDGNGGFYLGDWLYYCPGWPNSRTPNGYGIQFGGNQDTFIGGSFTRIVDYNNDFVWENVFLATDTSEVYEFCFDTYVAADKEQKDSTLRYLPDFFAVGSGLAFTIPAGQYDAELQRTMDGASISGGANVQYTGLELWGYEIVADIARKSSVSWPKEAEFPTYNLNVKLDLYSVTTDAEGKETKTKALEFGTFAEKIEVYDNAFNWYAAEDLAGIKKAYYNGNFELLAYSVFDEGWYMWNVSMSDAGVDSTGTSWLTAKGFLPYNATAVPDNTFSIEWYQGYLYLSATKMNGPFVYKGSEYDIEVYPSSGESGYFYDKSYLLGGYSSDDELIAFTDYPYNQDSVDGMFFYLPALNGGLGFYSYISLYWPEASSIKSSGKWNLDSRWEVRPLNVRNAEKMAAKRLQLGSQNGKPASAPAKLSAAKTITYVPKTLNTSKVVERAPKNVDSMTLKFDNK